MKYIKLNDKVDIPIAGSATSTYGTEENKSHGTLRPEKTLPALGKCFSMFIKLYGLPSNSVKLLDIPY